LSILFSSKKFLNLIKLGFNKSFFYLLILYFTSILGFGKFIFIAYFQEPSSFGKFASLIGILTFIGSLISFGEIEQTIKKYPNYWISKDFQLLEKSICNLLLLMFLRASLIIPLYFLFLIITKEALDLLLVVSSLFIVFNQSVNQLFTSLFRASADLSFFAYSQLIRTLVTIFIVSGAAFLFSWKGLIIAESISGILIFGVYIIFINRQFGCEKIKFKFRFEFNKTLFQNIFKVSNLSGLFTYLSTMVLSIPLYWDKFIIGKFNGYESVGIYSASFLIVQIGLLVNNVLSQKAGPDFIKHQINKKEKNLIWDLIKWIFIGFNMQIVVCLFFFIAIITGLFEHYLPKYNIGLEIFAFAGLLSLFQFNGLTEFFLISLNKEKNILFSSILFCTLFMIGYLSVGYLNLDLRYFYSAFVFSKICQIGLHFYFIKSKVPLYAIK
jgi:O-antigen/teichoic acid export membrane protein